jgi:hypothetical protein
MAQLFARVELRGSPGEDTYTTLHAYMRSQNWHQTITGSTATSNLPHAVYQGNSANDQPDLLSIATGIKAYIEANIWTRALVLVIRSADWAISAG